MCVTLDMVNFIKTTIYQLPDNLIIFLDIVSTLNSLIKI